MKAGSNTPWGAAQDVESLGPDVARVSTASHGGIRVTGAAAAAVPAAVWATMMNGRGWAEEDCELAIVATLLMDAGHITSPLYLSNRDEARDEARMMVAGIERYASIQIPDTDCPACTDTLNGEPVSDETLARMCPACRAIARENRQEDDREALD